MSATRLALGTALCLAGAVLVIFEIGMANGEREAFLRGGWIPCLAMILLGVSLLAAGLLILRKLRTF